ncbi:MAG TPA: nucleotide sugar dehydrogenase [Ktedonobacterales bacterium]|nr:nucleotide sugar dehydrogenase [Ktedonobacterales bacterium]
MKKVCVVGTGYVGLVTGACLAELENEVVCLDIDAAKIDQLRAGVMPIYEPGLDRLVSRNVSKGRLSFTTSYEDAVRDADYCFIAVNTPSIKDGAAADMTYVQNAAGSIAQHATRDIIIVNKSTMPVGSGDLVSAIAHKNLRDGGISVSVVSNPEFLREGSAVKDFQQPDRVVLGSYDQAAARRVGELYVPLRAPIVITDLYTAEMIKYASNAFLATKISFINEMARICDLLGADVKEVAAGMGYDKRIGRAFLDAGLGYGGSCFEGDETVFALNSPNVAAERFETLFDKATTSKPPFQGAVVELAQPTEQRVLAFDLETGQPTLADVRAITRRPYKGQMVTITTSMGRKLRVTADHPVVVHHEGAFDIVPAAEVRPDDELMALTALPTVTQASQPLNLIALLRGTALEADVYVTSDDGAFTARYAEYATAIPAEMLRYPEEIRQHNRMSLRLFRHLTEVGALDLPADALKLYTAKGAATMIRALIPVDADLLRFCGYYLAEGYIGLDSGREGAVRERVGICFHEQETEYIADVQRILTRWGLKYSERNGTHALTTLVSSRIFAWLLRDVLKCGVRSEDKALPRLAFNVAPELRHEVIRGALSGDGSVTTVQDGKNLMLEYATVSKALADGLTLLLQSVGVVPSLKSCMMNKSTQPAYILRVSGYEQISALVNAFGGKRREQITRLLAGYQRHIQPHGYQRKGAYAVLTVREVWSEPVETTVYSMETSTGTLIASSGLISHNCFPKDVKALAHMADQNGLHPQLLDAVMKINKDQRHVVIDKLAAELGGEDDLRGKTIAVLGLAFKDNTDDMRDAPSIDIIQWLLEKGAVVQAFDPVATETARAVLPKDGIAYCGDEYEAAKGADAVVVLTEWKQFRDDLDFTRLRAAMRNPEKGATLIDGRNLFDPEEMARLGFHYQGIGRGNGKRRAAVSNGATPSDH